MTLEEKGPIMPAPELSKFPEKVSKEIQSWEDITAATHWELYDKTKPDGADFYIGQNELGHIHLDGEVHLAIGNELAAVIIKNKLGKKFPYGNDWVTSPIESSSDVAHAVWLFKLSYRRLKGESVEKLTLEINNYSPQL